MEAGKGNILADAEVYRNTVPDEDCKACLFSEGEIVFCGSGTLSVIGRHRHGIATDDYLVMNDDATVIVREAARDAVHTNEFVRIESGALSILGSGADGIDCGGSMDIAGGMISITTSAAKGKCIKTVGDVWISGGAISLSNSGDAIWNTGTSEDADYSCAACLKTDGSLSLKGGNITANATGLSTRGLHVKRNFTMSGGSADVTTTGDAYQIDTLSDYTASNGMRVTGNMNVTGGKFIANLTGAGAMAIRVKGDYSQVGGTVRGSAGGEALGRIRELWKRPEDMTAEELRHLISVNRDHSWRPKASAKGIKVKGALTVRDGQLYGESASNEAIFFGWGETETKEVYNYPLYKWNSAVATPPVFSKYCTLESLGTVDNLTELELEDDAAYVNMGTEWRMPSTEQIKELISTNNTKSEWKRVNGVYGRTFTSLVNGDTIFIPAVGHRAGAAISFNEGDLLSGLYWTRSLVEENPETAWFLGLSSGSYGLASTGGTRFLGRPIRAVRR